MPAVSVIIPNYNHAPFLKERIDSILNQTYQDFELIILDDCSKDNSKGIIEGYRNHPKVVSIEYNTINSGSPFRQWKKGLLLAKGDYVWIAESDDVAELRFLKTLLKEFNNPQVALAYCQSSDVDEKGSILGNRLEWTKEFENNMWTDDFVVKGSVFAEYLKVKNVIPNVSACLMKREVLLDLVNRNKQLEKFKFAGDWYLWLKLCWMPAIEISFVSNALNHFRVSGTSTRHFLSLEKKEERILEELQIVNENSILFRKPELAQRYKKLKGNWFRIHSKFGILRKRFYVIAKGGGISSMLLIPEFICYKWKRK